VEAAVCNVTCTMCFSCLGLQTKLFRAPLIVTPAPSIPKVGQGSNLVLPNRCADDTSTPHFFLLAVGKEVTPVERNVWASTKDRLCKILYTGGSCKKTASVNGLFTLAVCIRQPLV
jgi:hypothetical protein